VIHVLYLLVHQFGVADDLEELALGSNELGRARDVGILVQVV